VAGADPLKPYSMRQLWWMACGAWDKELDAREHWQMVLGGKGFTPEQRAALHPLRRLETPSPPPPVPCGSTPEVAEKLDSLFIED
jgi:hypothetical protein